MATFAARPARRRSGNPGFDLHAQVVETLLDVGPHLVFDGLVVRTAGMHVYGGGLTGAAAQQVVHRHVRHLALDVPQRLVDAAQGVSKDGAVAPVGTDVGRLPDVLNVGDAAADEKRAEVVIDRRLDGERLPVVRGAAEAVEAGLGGLDLYDGEGVVVRLGQDRPDIADLRVAQVMSSNALPFETFA